MSRLALYTTLTLLFASPVLAEAPPSKATSITDQVKTVELDNGLVIYVLERPAAPTFAAYYQFNVGGASDPKGRSGIAHLLEHMLFKGTKDLGVLDRDRERELMRKLSKLWDKLHRELDREEDPFRPADEAKIAELKAEIEKVSAEHKTLIVKNEYDELMTRAGGVSMNASTGNDVTNYFIQLPANRLELWFELEGDRLKHPVFREFYSERDVVHEERRLRTENSPMGAAWETLETMIYQAHPYGTPVVGWPQDLLRLTREDAEDYFETYYSPSNCVMVLVGDLTVERVRELAKKHLGEWKRQEIPRLQITAEPEQKGARFAELEFDAEPRLLMAWPTVPEGHDDFFPLEVLGTIMGGLSSSRLDQSIVQDQRLATSMWGFNGSQRFGGYFMVSGSLAEGHTHAELEAAVQKQIDLITEEGVSDLELTRAKIRTESSRVRRLQSNLGLAFQLGRAAGTAGTVDYIDQYEAGILSVTSEQVQAVAERYLVPSRRNVVRLVKTPGAGGGGRGDGHSIEHQRGGEVQPRGSRHSKGFAKAMEIMNASAPITIDIPEIGKDVTRVELPCGPTLFLKEDRSAPAISVTLRWTGGYYTWPLDKLSLTSFAGQLLNEGGTSSLSPDELVARKEELGMSFNVGLGAVSARASLWSLERNFDESFALAMEVLTQPRFDEARLEVLKGKYIDRMKRRWDSPNWGASVIQEWVVNRHHPRLGYEPTRKEVEAVTAEALRERWEAHFGRNSLYVSVVGDFDLESMKEKLQKTFCQWPEAEVTERDWLAREPVVRAGLFNVEKDVPAPAVRMQHHIAVDREAPLADHAALEILNDILGGSGFRSRLMERLRSDEGLTYGIRSYLSHQGRPGVPGSVGVSYVTKRASVAKSIDSVLDEFRKIIDTDVNQAEVAEQIEAWRNRFVFQWDNDHASVARMMNHELDDRPYDFDQTMLDAVEKVTVAEVRRVAKQYLKPENLTISVFGALTDEDRATLDERFEVEVLPRATVFRGGYQEEEAPEEAARETD